MKRPRRFLALFLSLSLIFLAGGQARAADMTCTVTIVASSPEFLDDLTGVTLDLYRVARAEVQTGSDSYTLTPEEIYASLTLDQELDNAGWRQLSQEAAALALDGDAPVISGQGQQIRLDLEPGLYLLMVRGTQVQVTDEDGISRMAAMVRTENYIYTFLPELLALPGRMEQPEEGTWDYAPTVTLKPERSEQYGTLELRKTLTSYSNSNPGTFVFQIEGQLDGQTVYSDVVSMTFSGPGTQSLTLDRMPAGAEVTVTEVYSGAGYRLTSEQSQTVVISPSGTNLVEFINDYDGSRRTGYGIDNDFTYDPSNGWSWEQLE
jgi:hypothetical protein